MNLAEVMSMNGKKKAWLAWNERALNTRDLFRSLNEYFSTKVEAPRARYGKSQEIETLISEEALLSAKYLRGELKSRKLSIVQI
jgi:hypothetical protein